MNQITLSENVMVSDPCYSLDTWCQTKLNNVLPDNTGLQTYYFPNSSVFFDTQHEINTGFFENII